MVRNGSAMVGDDSEWLIKINHIWLLTTDVGLWWDIGDSQYLALAQVSTNVRYSGDADSGTQKRNG